MTETGWPLIPREVLPAAPVPAVRGVRHRQSVPHDLGRQLSIFGADTTEPSPADLVGLLAGPGRLGRMGGTARVSVPVDAAWRVHVLVAELVVRGLAASWAPVADGEEPEAGPKEPEIAAKGAEGVKDPGTEGADPGGQEEAGGQEQAGRQEEVSRVRFEVRTAYSRRLNGLARSWPAAAGDLFLSGPRLRLWVAAAGRPRLGGYGLGLDRGKSEPGKEHEAVDAALARAGLAGRVSDDGRCYVITGRRRLKRLAELVGDPPEAAPDELWPGGATA